MELGLEQKVVLVTGGSKGIGEAIVRSFLSEGARVANVNRPGLAGEQLAAEAARAGQTYCFIEGDLTEWSTSQQAIQTVVDAWGQLDVLVNNAGVNDGVGLEQGPEAMWQSLQRNLVHYYALAHYGGEELKRSRGAIVNIGSKVAVTGQGGTSGYAAAKGGINALTREWAVDLAPAGVRVNAVIPAETWTPLYDKWLQTMEDPTAARGAIERLIPLGQRFTTAAEIADMVVFLSSSRSSHTTGQIIFVDGGYTHLDRKCTAH